MGVLAAVVVAAAATVAALPHRRRRDDCYGLQVVAKQPPVPYAHESYAPGASVRGCCGGDGDGAYPLPPQFPSPSSLPPVQFPGDVVTKARWVPTASPALPVAGGYGSGCV